jgi:hypothetical protein
VLPKPFPIPGADSPIAADLCAGSMAAGRHEGLLNVRVDEIKCV